MLLSNRRFTVLLFFAFVYAGPAAQTVNERLQTAYAAFEKDTQLSSGIASLYVMNAKTGKVVFSKNERLGLAPASTQKIITAASAYELLGNDFRYKTTFSQPANFKEAQSKTILIKPCLLYTSDAADE